MKYEQNSGNLPVEMKKECVNITDVKTLWGPFKKIPNVRKFRVEVSEMDSLFQSYDINKRIEESKLIYTKYNNQSLNRYMEHQLRRMRRSNSKTYWRIAKHLMKRSNVFFIIALNHVFPKWHRDLKLSSVIRLATSTRRIAENLSGSLDFRRVYIQKANGKLRPLGVPTAPWRLYLHMFAQLLSNFFIINNSNHDSQHGYVPGRGTKTAWEAVLSKVIHSRDIYEFDLKSFFDNINISSITDKLVKKGVPKDIADELYFINCSAVKVKAPYKLNEFESQVKKLVNLNKIEDVKELPVPLSYLYRMRGVPQGAPTSPILATLALENSILDRPGLDAVMYADDGLYYGNIEVPVITPNSGMVTNNIFFNLEKTNWVKKDGVWLKPLKFLGLEYDGENLKSKTRDGKSLIYDKHDLIDEYLKRNYEGQLIGDSWEKLIRSKLWGIMQSRMYQGSWSSEDLEQCFELTFHKGSFVDKSKDHITIFNSSSLASKWLLNKLKTIKH